MKLLVKKLDPRAVVPTIAHPGEDLAYDIYALEDCSYTPQAGIKVRTGIAVSCYIFADNGLGFSFPKKCGLLIRDRSSVASKGIFITGGVVDAGYTGEIIVVMNSPYPFNIKAGDKIAQMIPIPIMTGQIEVVEDLGDSSRGEKGFGSSGV